MKPGEPLHMSELNRECQIRVLSRPHSSTSAWKISWTEEPGALQSMGSLRVGHNWVTSVSLFTFMYWRRKWQPTPAFLPGESQGRRSLVGCIVQSMESHRVGHDWSDLAVAVAAKSPRGLLDGSVVKNLPVNAGDVGSIPGMERSPGVEHSNSQLLESYSSWGHKRVRHDFSD